MMNFKRKALSVAIPLALTTMMTACGGSSGGDEPTNPGTDPQQPVARTTTFNFTVERPTLKAAVSNASSVSQFMQAALAVLIPKAMADDATTTDDIQVAIVNSQGRVIELVTPQKIEQESNGTFILILEGGERIDCVIIADVNDNPDVKVGDLLNPEEFVFTPTVEAEEPVRVDLTSSIAFDTFLEAVDSFDNVSVQELDNIIDNAQDFVDQNPATGATLTELINNLRDSIEGQVITQTALSASSSDEAPSSEGSGTIEGDRTVIEAFFRDVNTIAVLGGGLGTDEPAEQTDIEQLADNAELAADTLSEADATLDALSAVGETIGDYIDTLPEDLPETDTSVSISKIFEGDTKSSLTGSATYSDDGFDISIGGSYDGVTFTNVRITADATKTSTTASLNIGGTLTSEEATLQINKGNLSLENSELNSKAFSDVEADNEAFEEGLKSANLDLDVVLTAKNFKSTGDAVFAGQLKVDGVRSSEDFVEFNSAEPAEVSAPEAYYNISSIELGGSFSFDGESFGADAVLTSSNADSFVPAPQGFREGTEYTGLASYSYNGSDSLEFTWPGGSASYSAVVSEGVTTVTITEFLKGEIDYEDNFTITGTFNEYVSERDPFVSFDIRGASFETVPTQYAVGENLELAAEAFSVETEIETQDRYRELDVNLNLVTDLKSLGETTITVDLKRTGLESGIVVATIENISAADISADVQLAAAIVDDKLLDYTISNDNNFIISKENIDDKDDSFDITYGLETATVQRVAAGLKVTFSDGEFTIF